MKIVYMRAMRDCQNSGSSGSLPKTTKLWN